MTVVGTIAFAFWLLTAIGLVMKLYPKAAERNQRTLVIIWTFTWPASIPLTIIIQALEEPCERHFGRFIKSRADWLWEIR